MIPSDYETVTVRRSNVAMVDGRRVAGEPEHVGQIGVLVAPVMREQITQTGRATLRSGVDLYRLAHAVAPRRPRHRLAMALRTQGGHHMSRTRVKVVLNRESVREQLLHNRQLLDEVQSQVEGMADVHPAIKVYRNTDRERGNIVATIPMSVEDAHRGLLTDMLSKVRI